MDKLTKKQRSKNMQAVKSTGSRIETLFAKALRTSHTTFKRNDVDTFGKPDFVLKRLKIVIFCDSEFWHGKDWKRKKYEIKSNRKFWYKKIEGTIRRDREVNSVLRKGGWIVLRFWGRDIETKLNKCVSKVENTIRLRKKY